MNYFIVIITILLCSVLCNSVNILCLFGVPSRSHHFWNRNLVNTLAENNGHNLTVLSPDIDESPPKNVHYIHLETVYPYISNGSKPRNNIMSRSNQNWFETIISFYNFGLVGCEGSILSFGFKKLLDYPADFKFDLVIYDFTCGPCLLGFLHKFNYPQMVAISAFNTPQFTSALVSGRVSFGITTHFSINYGQDMTFFQRVKNCIVQIVDSIYRTHIHVPRIDKLARSMFKPNSLPYMSELERKTALVLVNSNPAFDSTEFLPLNVIQVGGLQIQKPKPLSEDLKAFLDNSTNGVVLFSLGTNFKGEMLPKEHQLNFLAAFQSLNKYNFLWKFESNNLPTLPSNVMVKSWFPQNDVLAHPNVKAFISHSGLLSIHEAIYHAIPIIGMPIYVDQHRNIHLAELLGIAKKLNFHNLKTEIIQETISEILENPNYREKMFLTSKRFRDQPEEPLERAVWWIEWVLRNSNSKHLQSKTKELGFLRVNLLDILLFSIIIIFIVFYLIKFCAKNILINSKKNSLKMKNS